MSKSSFASFEASDRIPTYEEALASSSTPHLQQSAVSNTVKFRRERTRRVQELVTDYIIPCFTSHISGLCSHLTIIMLPANALSAAVSMTANNIVSPSLSTYKTTGQVITLSGSENHSVFWTQQIIVQELDQILRQELSQPTRRTQDSKAESQPDSAFQVQPAPATALPARPRKSSWLKRTLALPGPEHDPTGETGKWNLGWRDPNASEEAADQNSWKAQPRAVASELQADEVAVHTRLQDVSFRTESEWGLLETTTVKCIWMEIEVGT